MPIDALLRGALTTGPIMRGAIGGAAGLLGGSLLRDDYDRNDHSRLLGTTLGLGAGLLARPAAQSAVANNWDGLGQRFSQMVANEYQRNGAQAAKDLTQSAHEDWRHGVVNKAKGNGVDSYVMMPDATGAPQSLPKGSRKKTVKKPTGTAYRTSFKKAAYEGVEAAREKRAELSEDEIADAVLAAGIPGLTGIPGVGLATSALTAPGGRYIQGPLRELGRGMLEGAAGGIVTGGAAAGLAPLLGLDPTASANLAARIGGALGGAHGRYASRRNQREETGDYHWAGHNRGKDEEKKAEHETNDEPSRSGAALRAALLGIAPGAVLGMMAGSGHYLHNVNRGGGRFDKDPERKTIRALEAMLYGAGGAAAGAGVGAVGGGILGAARPDLIHE